VSYSARQGLMAGVGTHGGWAAREPLQGCKW
jgi:hypothetical protein